MSNIWTRTRSICRHVNDPLVKFVLIGADLQSDVPEAVDGVPGAIQIMGRPMRDEELMEVMNVVESVLEKAA